MKNKKLANKLLILIPAFWACSLDLIITLLNQPSEYWYGNLKIYREGNPLVEILMKNHISGIFIFVILWLLTIIFIGYFLSPKSLRTLTLFVLVAHTFGASTWLVEIFGFWSAICLFLINSIIYISFEDIYIIKSKSIF